MGTPDYRDAGRYQTRRRLALNTMYRIDFLPRDSNGGETLERESKRQAPNRVILGACSPECQSIPQRKEFPLRA
jgi:hypothetical protein